MMLDLPHSVLLYHAFNVKLVGGSCLSMSSKEDLSGLMKNACKDKKKKRILKKGGCER